MEVEQLIEEVKHFPVLYDQAHEKYRNVDYKEKIWTTIAENLNVKDGGEECKKRWFQIRDNMRKTVKKRKSLCGQPSSAVYRKYKFEDNLDFLLPHLMDRETSSSVPIATQLGQEDKDSIEQTDSNKEKIMAVKHNDHEKRKFQIEDLYSSSLDDSTYGTKKLKHDASQESTSLSQLMSVTLTEKEQLYSSGTKMQESQHPVDAFLAGIAPTLKSLHPVLLNQAKTQIFATVQNFEMKQLVGSQDMYYTGYSASTHDPPCSPETSRDSKSSIH